jgi:hypothetical protein
MPTSINNFGPCLRRGVLVSRRIICAVVVGATVCLGVFLVSTAAPRKSNVDPGSPSLTTGQTPTTAESKDSQQDAGVARHLVIASKESGIEKKEFAALPPPKEVATEIHKRVVAGLDSEVRQTTKKLYGTLFQQLSLPSDVQEKVIDILTHDQKQLEQQAFEAAQSGNIPVPPSPDEIRSQQEQQNQQLRAVLGDAGFAEFAQYQASIPDRLTLDAVNQEGGNLTESQSQQLLQILAEARQQIIGQSGITQNLASMPPGDAMAMVQQQQSVLQQTIGSRVQNLLTPQQATVLQNVFVQQNMLLGGG